LEKKVIKEIEGYKSNVTVSSNSITTLAKIYSKCPNIKTTLNITSGEFIKKAIGNILFINSLYFDRKNISNRKLKNMVRKNIDVYVGVISSPLEAEELAVIGVKGIYTNNKNLI